MHSPSLHNNSMLSTGMDSSFSSGSMSLPSPLEAAAADPFYVDGSEERHTPHYAAAAAAAAAGVTAGVMRITEPHQGLVR